MFTLFSGNTSKNIIHYHYLNGAFRKGNLLPTHYFQQSVTGIYFLTSKLMFFDFKNAFDTVLHGKLMEKVSRIDFGPKTLSWLCSYLSGRKQYVMVNGEQSQATLVRSGVPQGSVLGPLLFLIYINNITELHCSEQSRLSLYADDILLYMPSSSECSFSEIQQDIDHLFDWS